MLHIHHLRKHYGATTILENITLIINHGEHLGLIGANGTGKSTLLRCIVGTETPDGGTITRTPPTLSIGYLPQTLGTHLEQPIAHLLATAQTDILAAETALQQTAEHLATTNDPTDALAAYDTALARFEALGGYTHTQRTDAILQGLGLGAIDRDAPLGTLSGGQKTRLGLALLLLGAPDLLLLDEPTNHLDITALDWLEHFIQTYRGAALIVSHDREFLDRTTTRTLALNATTHTLKSYPGNYSAYNAARAHEQAQHLSAWKEQQTYIAHVQTDIIRLKTQALNIEHSSTPTDTDAKFHLSGKSGSKKVARKARARERKLERYLESDERVEKPHQQWHLNLDFGPPPPSGRAVLRLENITYGYGTNPALIENLSLDLWYGERVALIGPNGAGKTTLLRIIAGQLQPWSGTYHLGTNIRLGILAQEHETLEPTRSILDHARQTRAMSETEARNFLHLFLFGGDNVFRPVGTCSLGERSRLQLALLVLRGCNLLLLDEPLNHLDIESREHFETALEAFQGTILIVAHDRAFLRSFAQRIIDIHERQCTTFPGGYDAYLHWQQTQPPSHQP